MAGTVVPDNDIDEKNNGIHVPNKSIVVKLNGIVVPHNDIVEKNKSAVVKNNSIDVPNKGIVVKKDGAFEQHTGTFALNIETGVFHNRMVARNIIMALLILLFGFYCAFRFPALL